MPAWNDFIASIDLFRDPLLAGLAAGIALGLLSIFIVLRRMVFVSAALAQSAGLGVALAFYLEIVTGAHISAVWGAALASLATGLLVSIPPDKYKITREALLAMVYIGAGAIAIVIGEKITQEAHDIHAILFGTAVLVRHSDMLLLAAGALITTVCVTLFWRGLLFSNFDPEGAAVQGLPVKFLNAGLMLLIISMDAVATRALGALPVFAFSTLPAIAALGFTRTLLWAALLAATFGALAGFGGYLIAFFADSPVGATQTLLLLGFAMIGLLVRRFS